MASFGDRLKKQREKRGISLEEVSLATKVGVRMLQAIEEQRFELLPGGIFNKGFIRAYARHLGLDEEQAIADYLAASEPTQPVAAAEPLPLIAQQVEMRAQAESPRRGIRAEHIPWEKFAFALFVVAFGFAVWGSFSREGAENRTAAVAPSTPIAASTKDSHSDNPPVAAAIAQPEPATQAAEDKPRGAFLVLVQARQDSWVQITADGHEVMHDTLPATSRKAIEARKEVVVKAGNIGGLDFSFNGKPLPVQGSHNEVKILNFDPNGLQNPVF
jgi:cytoskeleton protein RodZ